MSMPIVNTNMLEQRLDGRSPVRRAELATRMVLRMFPLVFTVLDLPTDVLPSAKTKQFVLDCFRAAFAAWATQRTAEQNSIVTVRIRDGQAAELRAAVRSIEKSTHILIGDAAAFAGAAIIYASSHRSLRSVADAIAEAASTVSDSIKADARKVMGAPNAVIGNDNLPEAVSWQAIEADVALLESNEFEELMNQPLWLNEIRGIEPSQASIPSWTREPLEGFARSARASNGPWGVIAEWYWSLLPENPSAVPRSAFGDELDIEIATKDESFWGRHPDDVMTDIAKIVGWEWNGGRAEQTQSDEIDDSASSSVPETNAADKSRPVPALRRPDSLRTLSDEPTTDDQLGRRLFARTLVERMDNIISAEGRAGFAVHLYAPWGAGKTSVLMMMEDIMKHPPRRESTPWAVVTFNAWRHERIAQPWWPLLKQVKSDCHKNLFLNLRFGRAAWLSLRRMWWYFEAHWLPTFFAILIVGALSYFLFLFDATMNTQGDESGTLISSLGGVFGKNPLAVIAALSGIFVGAIGIMHRLIFGSSINAKRYFEQSRDPLGRLKGIFRKTASITDRKICVFIDDLDRCNADYVVDLLEGVQTLFRHRNVAFVVAADRQWIRSSFENRYKTFKNDVGKAGESLGYLFLEKVFQMSVPIPGIGDKQKKEYWKSLLSEEKRVGQKASHWMVRFLQAAEDQLLSLFAILIRRQRGDQKRKENTLVFDQAVEVRRKSIREIYADGITSEDAREFLRDNDTPIDRAAAGLEVNVSPAAEEVSEHLFTKFDRILPENPRVMKRMVNALAMRRNIGIFDSDEDLPEQILARWTVLEQRYPVIADLLVEKPNWTSKLTAEIQQSEIEKQPYLLRPFLNDDVVRDIFIGGDTAPLTEDHVRDITRGSRT